MQSRYVVASKYIAKCLHKVFDYQSKHTIQVYGNTGLSYRVSFCCRHSAINPRINNHDILQVKSELVIKQKNRVPKVNGMLL